MVNDSLPILCNTFFQFKIPLIVLILFDTFQAFQDTEQELSRDFERDMHIHLLYDSLRFLSAG